MKKIRLWLLLTTMIMIAFPWLSVTFVKGDHGMANAGKLRNLTN